LKYICLSSVANIDNNCYYCIYKGAFFGAFGSSGYGVVSLTSSSICVCFASDGIL